MLHTHGCVTGSEKDKVGEDNGKRWIKKKGERKQIEKTN